MSQFQVIKTTKKFVHIQLTYKTGKTGKFTIKDKKTFDDVICYIINAEEIVQLLNVCEFLLDKQTVKGYKNFYMPSASQKSKAAKERKARESWYKKNEKRLNDEIGKMSSHPGFLGNRIDKNEVKSVITTEVFKIYGVQ